MTKPKRYYSKKTLNILFALSKNQCAHPDCTNAVIEPATEESDALVAAHICHIYAISKDGPRGRPGLTEKQLNSPENLILLCRHHHGIVDGQPETYPAKTLVAWKQNHELESQNQRSAALESVKSGVFFPPSFPTALVDQTIKDEVDILRKSRFFAESDNGRSSLILARRIVEGELAGGTDAIRSCALAWCARFLSRTEEQDKAEEYLTLAKSLGSCQEIEIANAFISSQKGDKNTALRALASIDASISRSAAFMVVAHHDGSQGAVDWLKTAGFAAADLDPDGKSVFLMHQLQLGQWEAAREALAALNDDDLREAPVLHHIKALTHLLSTVPTELRAIVLNQLPFEAASFPLASDAAALEARRVAHRHFIVAAQMAQQLNCSSAATIDDEYALWLELRDPDETDNGRKRLKTKLRDPKFALRLVPLGLQFGITLDPETVEREIERQIALHGGITHDAAIARFALALTQKTPEDVANYVARHRDELAKYLDKKSLQFLQIEMLSRAGLSERAKECLDILLKEGLSEEEESRFQRIIAGAEGSDPIGALKEQFKKTNSLRDLVILVDELETRGEWDGLCEYGEILFERTRSLSDAKRLATALSNTQKTERLVELIKANSGLLAQSKKLQMLYCWSLYTQGALLEARSELEKLSGDRDNPNYRALQINLGIALGDWNSLSAFVANECIEKNKRSARDLIGAAQLALNLGSPHAKELVFAAARKGSDDAGVLTIAYFLASNAGWEDDADAFQWINEAAVLSGSDGPVQKMTLKDILDRKPEWDRRESETWRLLNLGDIPMFIAAQSLNKSLIDLMLFPALANLAESDPRRRGVVPAYSGKRQPTSLNNHCAIGMDATALLTLSYLSLLDNALDAFDTVHIPHSTLAWLFEEKQKASFHQPSRIKGAHQVRHLLATEVLEKFIPTTVPDSDLAAQIGDELAVFIAEAEKVRDDNTKRIVIRPSPVHRVTSLMEEEADLTAHANVLSSCQAIVDKLRQKGLITASEEKKACAYLQLHEKSWPNQPEIADGAILYLDDLATTYFLHLGILEKLQAADLKPIVSPGIVSQANELISYETISGRVNDAIECIRISVNSRIESGKIKVGRRHNTDEPEEQSILAHPTAGVIALARVCDAIISDDRFLNQHSNINDGSAQAPIFSTLELLDTLVASGSITPEARLEYRTLLRRAGYVFVPVTDEELSLHLHASTIKDGKVIETAELKAIRENILRVQMGTWLQLPKEEPWLSTLRNVFLRVLKDLWKSDADFSSVKAHSDWIIDQFDVRSWAHSIGGENGDNIVKLGRGVHILMILLPPGKAPQAVKDKYWSWAEDRILVPIKEQYPDLYSWIVEWYRKQIAKMVDMDLTEEETK